MEEGGARRGRGSGAAAYFRRARLGFRREKSASERQIAVDSGAGAGVGACWCLLALVLAWTVEARGPAT
jgi:hypothetical protein